MSDPKLARSESPDGGPAHAARVTSGADGGGHTPAPVPRIPATEENCRGCKNAYRNQQPGKCWSLSNARMVPMFQYQRSEATKDLRLAPRTAFTPVTKPHCYMDANRKVGHTMVLPGASR